MINKFKNMTTIKKFFIWLTVGLLFSVVFTLYDRFTLNKPSKLFESSLNKIGTIEEFSFFILGGKHYIGFAIKNNRQFRQEKWDGNYTIEYYKSNVLIKKEIINKKSIGRYYKDEDTIWSIHTKYWTQMPLGTIGGVGRYRIKITVNKAESQLKDYNKTVYFFVDKPDAKLMKHLIITPKERKDNKRRKLLKNLIDANETNQTLLDFREALNKNSLSKVKIIIEMNNNIIANTNMVFKRRALHYSSFHNNLELTKYLISKGANIHHKDELGKNALAYAIENNATETAKLLLDSGVKIDEVLFVQNYLQYRLMRSKYTALTPLQYASSNALYEMLELLFEYNIVDNAINFESGMLEKKGNAIYRISRYLNSSNITNKEREKVFKIFEKYNFELIKPNKSNQQIGY